MKFLLAIPTLIIPLIVFNILVFTSPDILNTPLEPVYAIALPSGGIWHAYVSDFFVIGGILLLIFEIYKSSAARKTSIFEEILSLCVFLVFLIQFIVVPNAANSTCVFLMAISLLDLIGSFILLFRR